MSSWAVSGWPSPPSGPGPRVETQRVRLACLVEEMEWRLPRPGCAQSGAGAGSRYSMKGGRGRDATTAGTMPTPGEMSLDPERSHAVDELVVANPPEPF